MKGKKVHPCPPAEQLALLPAAMLALAAALTTEEQEVLAYLLSGGSGERGEEKFGRRMRPHKPKLGCGCFSCYKSFWARWDASPNRQLIHHILDAFEETLEAKERALARKRMRRRHRRSGRGGRSEEVVVDEEVVEMGLMMMDGGDVGDDDGDEDDDDDDDDDDDKGAEDGMGGGDDGIGGKSSVRWFMSFIRERVWGVWN